MYTADSLEDQLNQMTGISGGPAASMPMPPPSSAAPAPPSNPWETDDQIRSDPYGFVKHHFSFMSPTTQNLEMIFNALSARNVPVRWATRAGGARSDDKFYIGNTMYDWLGDVGGSGASWYGGEVPQGGGNGSEFGDPWGSSMEALTRGYIDKLSQDPSRNWLNQFIEQLLASQGRTMQRGQEFADSMGKRVGELRGPAYNDAQIQALRTGATESLERRRQETLKNEREKVYARGFEPTSGLVQEAEQNVNRTFEPARTEIESNLLRDQIETTRANQRYADQLEQLIQQALAGADATSLGYGSTLADIENRTELDRLARMREQIAATAGPLGLINQRMQGANQTLALSSPGGAANSFMQMLQQLMNQQNMNQNNSNANWAAIAQMLDIFLS